MTRKKQGKPNEERSPSGGLPNAGLPFGSLVRPAEPRLTLSENRGELRSPTAAAIRGYVFLMPPYDVDNSVPLMMTEWYKRMRAINSGAANYNTKVLYSMFSIIRALRALWYSADKALHALLSNEPNFVNQSAFFYYLCGGKAYAADTVKIAQWTNDLAQLGKNIEALCIPDFDILKNDRYVFGTVWKEEAGMRSSYYTNLLMQVQYATLVQTDGQWALSMYTRGFENTSTGTLIDAYIEEMKTALAQISGTYVYSILQGDMIKTYGLGAYQVNLLKYHSEGLHIDNTVRGNRVIQNAKLFLANNSSIGIDQDAGILVPYVNPGSYNFPGSTNKCYAFAIDDGSPEELYLYSLLRPVLGVSDGDDKPLYNRGYFLKTAEAMADGSVTSATSRFAFSTAIRNAQSSTQQSTSEAAHTNLANVASLWKYCPAYCPRGSVDTVVWQIERIQEYVESDMNNLITQAIRKELESKAFVAQSNSAKRR